MTSIEGESVGLWRPRAEEEGGTGCEDEHMVTVRFRTFFERQPDIQASLGKFVAFSTLRVCVARIIRPCKDRRT